MKKQVDLLNGNILPTLTKLSIPIVLTMMMQMAYNMVDMIWIGKLGANSVAAVGVAGMFGWFSSGLVMMARVGGQVKTGHSLGNHDRHKAVNYTSAAFQIAIVFALLFGVGVIVLAPTLIKMFHLNNIDTINNAIMYLRVTCGFIIFSFVNQVITGIYNATGDSHTPFVCNSIGLVVNLFLDPVLIFGIGIFPKMGVLGAGVATVFAQFIVLMVFVFFIRKSKNIFNEIQLNIKYASKYYQDILKIGFPMALQSMLFSVCSMIIARFVAGYGDGAVAAQKIGSQIEAISWNMADGFEAAINAFIAQNYGAKLHQRVKKGYRTIMVFVVVWGVMCSLALIIFPKEIFTIFLNDSKVLPLGVNYLTIIGYSQLFMVAEITVAGAFSGLGNSFPPSIVSIVFTLGRIPLIIVLTQFMGLDGIWWAISLSSILKGIISCGWFSVYKNKKLGLS